MLILLLALQPMGCWKDRDKLRILEDLEVKFLSDNYKNRSHPISQCYQTSSKMGNKYFAIQDGGMCLGSYTADFHYKEFGNSTECSEGKGGGCANSVYQINKPGTQHNYIHIHYFHHKVLCILT